MARRTRWPPFPRVLIKKDSDTDESSSESEGEKEPDQQVSEPVTTLNENGGKSGVNGLKSPNQKKNCPITISLKKVCKVCKGTGHEARFRGATYIDCPKKPCFLCKQPGHTTVSCPHRVATEHGVVPAPRRNSQSALDFIFERQLRPSIPNV